MTSAATTNDILKSAPDADPVTPSTKEVFHTYNRLGLENSGIEGTGIGLSIAKQLITMMGGSINFNSSPNEGSSFWVDMPGENA